MRLVVGTGELISLIVIGAFLSPVLSISHSHSQLYERQSDDLQTFTGTLGGAAPPITNSGNAQRPFEVDGNTFTDFADAGERSCDVQFNNCQLLGNSGGGIQVSQCNDQRTQCNTAQAAAQDQSFDTSPQAQGVIDPDFDLVCDP